MRESTAIRSALCLLRLLPMLDVLESPVRQPVNDVVRGCLGSSEIADGVLISLDEFREAVGELQDFDHPASFERSIVGIALIAAGAEAPRRLPLDEAISQRAVRVWSAFATLVTDRTLPFPADFAERERSAQREDERALTASERDPMAVTRRADQLALSGAATMAELSRVTAMLGWRPAGPCGLQCNWPVCDSSAANCVRHRFQPQQTLAARLRRKHGAEPRAWYLISIDLLWDSDDEPFEFVTEIGSDGYELRKVAQYADGRLVCVDREHRMRGSVELGSERVPSWTELEGNDDVHVEETSAEFFEERWMEGLTGYIAQPEPPTS